MTLKSTKALPLFFKSIYFIQQFRIIW